MTPAQSRPTRPSVLLCCLGALALLAACGSDNVRDVGRDEYTSGSRRDLVRGIMPALVQEVL